MSKTKHGAGGETGLHYTATTAFGSQLLTELRVTNFKALTGAHAVTLAPLTLVYGPNAAGKSSIIQSLLLLAQSVQADSFTPQGPLVDVRDFRHVVNGHDPSKELMIGVHFAVEEEDTEAIMLASFADHGREVPSIKFEGGIALTFHSPDGGGSPAVRASLEVGSAALIEPDPAPVVEGFDAESGPWGPYVLRWTLDLGDTLATEALAAVIENLQSLPGEAQGSAALLRCASDLVDAGQAESAALECWVDPIDWESGFHGPSHLRLSLEPAKAPRPGLVPIPLEGRGLLPEDESAVKEMLKHWATGEATVTVFHSLKPVTDLFSRVEMEARGLFRFDAMVEDPSPAARRYREQREWDYRPEAHLVTLGPIRPAPRRVQLDDGAADSAALALIRRLYQNNSLLGRVNEWLARLEIPYFIGVDRLVSQRSGVEHGYSFELTDTRTNVEVSLADVGYGVSQVLPIITECVGATRSIICIEQPELHLHPRLAANLAELLVETATRGNQIIAETHSENVLLRVQRLIREGQIAASDVAVLYVDNRFETGATVSRLRLDDEGDLLDRWPGGFFDDRLADVLGIPS